MSGTGRTDEGETRDLHGVAGQIQEAAAEMPRPGGGCRCGRALPSPRAVGEITDALRRVCFPWHFGDGDPVSGKEERARQTGCHLENLEIVLAEQVHRGLCYTCREEDRRDCDERGACALTITRTFIGRLPAVRRLLNTDIQAAYDGDPAATSTDEAILCYPGVVAVTSYRLAHELHVLRVPLIPRMITEQAHSETGIDIHPGAVIGEGFFIDHGTGVVIGETCIIGNRVRLYQGVTLGAKSFPLDQDGKPVKGVERHPIVEDDVIIYSGATILGRVVVGRGSVIGGNVWLTHGVAPGSHVSQAKNVEDVFDRGAGI